LLGGAASLLVARWTLGAMVRVLPSDRARMIHVALETHRWSSPP
jgi:hypothetical protein